VSGTVRLGGLAGLEIVGGEGGIPVYSLYILFCIPIYFKTDGGKKQGITAVLI
jgi:hypothetical protein